MLQTMKLRRFFYIPETPKATMLREYEKHKDRNSPRIDNVLNNKP